VLSLAPMGSGNSPTSAETFPAPRPPVVPSQAHARHGGAAQRLGLQRMPSAAARPLERR
jgi:hypothetical protein